MKNIHWEQIGAFQDQERGKTGMWPFTDLFSLYSEAILQGLELVEDMQGLKKGGKIISNLR